MSGFAVLVEPHTSALAREDELQSFVQLVNELKQLDWPGMHAIGKHCTAAKLDSPASLHCGIVKDEATGSWLLAAGTVVRLTGDNLDVSLEGLLQDYLDQGAPALERYDGHFALIIYNGHEESLSVISDPLGLFSIFYGSGGQRTWIASSALAVAKRTGAAPDVLATECFLATGRAYGRATLWQNVKRLPAATILKITADKISEIEYWMPTPDEAVARLSFDQAIEHTVEAMSRLFKRLLEREGRVWADLTGGVDTRLTTLFISKVGIPFITYCVGPADHPDVKISRQISQVMGWEYRQMPLPEDWAHEQCRWLDVALSKGDARLEVVQLAAILAGQSERAKTLHVHVLGVGADEWRILGCWQADLFNCGKLDSSDCLLDSIFLLPVPASVLRQDWTDQVRTELKAHLMRLAQPFTGAPNALRSQVMFIRQRYPTHVGAYLSASSGLMRSLAPFCFKESVRLGLSLDYRWRINYHMRFVRTLLERENPRLANITTVKSGPAVPLRLTNVHRFAPLWKLVLNRLVELGTQKLVGKSVALWREPAHTAYPLPAWQQGWLAHAASMGLLTPSQMRSGALYQADAFQALVAQAQAPGFPHADFLARVLTIEMAMRAVGGSVE